MQIKLIQRDNRVSKPNKIDPAIQNRIFVFGVHLTTSASIQIEVFKS